MCLFGKNKRQGYFGFLGRIFGRKRREQAEREDFARKLVAAKTANEITSLIGLTPIKGRSGPRMFY